MNHQMLLSPCARLVTVVCIAFGSVAAAHLAQHGVRAHLTRFPADFLDAPQRR
jgi:hypothetical protein